MEHDEEIQSLQCVACVRCTLTLERTHTQPSNMAIGFHGDCDHMCEMWLGMFVSPSSWISCGGCDGLNSKN